jgi:hypothetical protein
VKLNKIEKVRGGGWDCLKIVISGEERVRVCNSKLTVLSVRTVGSIS